MYERNVVNAHKQASRMYPNHELKLISISNLHDGDEVVDELDSILHIHTWL